jgi:hypothetical protein
MICKNKLKFAGVKITEPMFFHFCEFSYKNKNWICRKRENNFYDFCEIINSDWCFDNHLMADDMYEAIYKFITIYAGVTK